MPSQARRTLSRRSAADAAQRRRPCRAVPRASSAPEARSQSCSARPSCASAANSSSTSAKWPAFIRLVARLKRPALIRCRLPQRDQRASACADSSVARTGSRSTIVLRCASRLSSEASLLWRSAAHESGSSAQAGFRDRPVACPKCVGRPKSIAAILRAPVVETILRLCRCHIPASLSGVPRARRVRLNRATCGRRSGAVLG